MNIKLADIIHFLFYLFFIVIPLESILSFRMANIPFTATTLILLLLFFLYLTFMVYSKNQTKVPKNTLFLFYLFLLIILFDVMAVLVHKSSPNYFSAVENFFALFLFFLAAVIFSQSPQIAVKGLRMLAVALMAVSVLSLLQSLQWIPPFFVINPKPLKIGKMILPIQRIAPLRLPNGLYNIFNFSVLPLLLVSIIQKKKVLFKPLISLVGSILIISAVFVTQSRSSWIALGVIFMVFIFGLTWRLYRKNKLHFVLTLGIISIVILLLFLSSAPNLFYETLYKTNPSSVESRINQYKTAWRLITSHPIIGIGHGKFQEIYDPLPKSCKESKMLHNYFLSRAVAAGALSGLILITLFLWMEFKIGKTALRETNSRGSWISTAFLSSFTAFCIELSFFPAPSGLDIIWIYFALIVTYPQIKKALISGS
jgi:O-antigen ligase